MSPEIRAAWRRLEYLCRRGGWTQGNSVGLCASIDHLLGKRGSRPRVVITQHTATALRRTIAAYGRRWGRAGYFWPRTTEGYAARHAFCRRQAARR